MQGKFSKLLIDLHDKEKVKKYLPVLLILIALPLVVLLSLQQQNVRQKAASISCNDGLTCGTCTANSPTCSFGNGTQTCTYTSSLDGSSCNQVAIPNVFCHVNNCQAGAICNSSQVCVTQATPTPTNQKIVQFPSTGTQAQFTALLADMTIDVIEIGTPNTTTTYSNWHDLNWNVDRSAKPLLIRPAANATIIWDGNGGSGDGLFYPGWSNKTSYFTFDPAGTGGSFHINNFVLTETGLISTAWVENVTFNGFQTSGTTAPSEDGMTAWAFYVSTDGVHRAKNITVNNWIVDNTASTVGHEVDGFQTEHDPQADGVTVNNWTVKGGYWALVGRLSTTGLNVSGWTITGTRGPSFDSEGPSGVVKNMHATNSGAPIIDAPMVDGGGNVWK